MFYAIEHDPESPPGVARARITLGANGRTYSIAIPWAEMRTRDARELIEAWATTILALPNSRLNPDEIANLIATLNERYPLTDTKPGKASRWTTFF